eukprot:CAMPEP_0170888496 /NCGR_PEP_ID=MMETSP0734-20130129/38501_1 /TAXON_ID=186038 /ORGANISM="Fragilariopsis kerguelensis, Strain L26-C5" /LENGTH=139 /DNA_ID=CAMNT_0011276093 /DNA_START=18 /DNA_END=437 /DNA_ORIENTATION=+
MNSITNNENNDTSSSFLPKFLNKGPIKLIIIGLVILTLLKNLLLGGMGGGDNGNYYYYSSSSSFTETRTYSRDEETGQPMTETSRKESSSIRSNIPGIVMNENNNNNNNNDNNNDNGKTNNNRGGDSDSVYSLKELFFE